jgi:ubiquinone/menaquinone biosynthesis C-methylase UbiE
MDDKKACHPYESAGMTALMGETLRPGGFSLTDIGALYCGLSPEAPVLDLGCGRGATVNHLITKYGIPAVGIDSSADMIRAAKDKYPAVGFFHGEGEQLPFDNESFEGVFAECTLSLMKNRDAVLSQVHRVLKENGWFIISDIYARHPDAVSELGRYPEGGCMCGLHDLEQLLKRLEQAGFLALLTQDYSQYLSELLVKIVFSYGSLREFWQAEAGERAMEDDYYHVIKRCKPGYFLMIARKREKAYG